MDLVVEDNLELAEAHLTAQRSGGLLKNLPHFAQRVSVEYDPRRVQTQNKCNIISQYAGIKPRGGRHRREIREAKLLGLARNCRILNKTSSS